MKRLPQWFLIALLFAPSLAVASENTPRVTRVGSERPYTFTASKKGVEVYTDRRYTIQSLPKELEGHPLLQTPNGDEHIADANHIELEIPQPSAIHICFDARAHRRAPWLDSWLVTNWDIVTEDTGFIVYQKLVSAGKLILGGNDRDATGAASNYFVIVVPGMNKAPARKKNRPAPVSSGETSPQVVPRDAELPSLPPGFSASIFAREPLVRNPASLCFDRMGRLFVGQGPQFRKPRPDTPGDSILMLIDTDGDGVADESKTFASGFNNIQSMAWRGRDLWGCERTGTLYRARSRRRRCCRRIRRRL